MAFIDQWNYNAKRVMLENSNKECVSLAADIAGEYSVINSQYLNPTNTPNSIYNAILDYSINDVKIYAGPSTGKRWIVKKFSTLIESDEAPSTIANGIRFFIERNGTEVNDLLGGGVIKNRLEWMIYVSRFIDLSSIDKKFDRISGHLVFNEVGNFVLEDTDKIVIHLRDDFTSLNIHKFILFYNEI